MAIRSSTAEPSRVSDTSTESWSDRARVRMRELRISKTALAESLGVSSMAVTYYFNGRTDPPLRSMMLICRHLQVSADWLLFGGTNSPLSGISEPDRLTQQIRSLDAPARRDIEAYIRVKSALAKSG